MSDGINEALLTLFKGLRDDPYTSVLQVDDLRCVTEDCCKFIFFRSSFFSSQMEDVYLELIN